MLKQGKQTQHCTHSHQASQKRFGKSHNKLLKFQEGSVRNILEYLMKGTVTQV